MRGASQVRIHPDGEHSLSTLEESNGILQGQLRVSHLTLGDTSLPIEELVPSNLYMVLYAGDLATGDDEGSETGRDWIRLAFREGERE